MNKYMWVADKVNLTWKLIVATNILEMEKLRKLLAKISTLRMWLKFDKIEKAKTNREQINKSKKHVFEKNNKVVKLLIILTAKNERKQK